MRNDLSIKLYDKNGDLFKVLDRKANVDWAYRNIGGCGQANLTIENDFDYLEDSLEPQTSVRVFINNALRYSGKLVEMRRELIKNSEKIVCSFFGYVVELDDVIVKKTYEGQSVSDIVTDIMNTFVVPNTNITFDLSDVDAASYSVVKLALNHTAKDAIQLLGQLAGNFEWGVDRDKAFFFKTIDKVVRNVFLIGKDVSKSNIMRKDEDVVNVMNVFGSDGSVIIATVQSSLSISKFGRKEANVFESSINELSDANRYGQVLLKNTTNSQRRIKFTAIKEDIFLEENVPVGAVALDDGVIREKVVYGTVNKYGRNIKYGNLTRDQIAEVRYSVNGGGLMAMIELKRDIPNLANQQKQVEFQIKNVQRR